MSKPPSVAVITCFLNAEQFLFETITSVFQQTFQDWELLLIDDGATDGSTEIAKRWAREHPERVRYFEHADHRNRGPAASRNVGLIHTRAPLIAPLDSDDVWLPNKLERQVAILSEHREAAMVYGRPLYWGNWSAPNVEVLPDCTPKLGVEPGRVYRPPRLLVVSLKGAAFDPCPSDLLIKRDTLVALGGFEESLSYSMFEDMAMLAKVYSNAPVFVADETWTRYRLHPKSLCAVQIKTGLHDVNRASYLRWLMRYLQEQQVTDADVVKRVRAMLWSSRHPQVASLLRPAVKAIRRIGEFGRFRD